MDSLRKWLANYPWLLILDGLDEVPGSANRVEVVRLVNELLIDVANENGDVFVLVTTRPQGYKNDFPQEQFQHWYLTPLSIPRALHCARRFADVHMGEADRDRVIQDLGNAAKEEATARLMRSPLQVTIMATLAQSGSIPDDRWRLFSEYYRIIYEREVAKKQWKVLESNREDIYVIHNRVALILQIECERTAKTDARLTASRLQQIVSGRLSEHCLSDPDLTQLTQEILQAASDRLVFLVGLEADRVGFEIRSLQEFMAARALLHGRERAAIERLQHIAPIPHWRNTFLFAAANIFSEQEWLGDTITGICSRLNSPENDLVGASALAGSQLALDLLEAGAAARQPKFRGVLSQTAMSLLRRPPSQFQTRLASVPFPGNALEDAIREHLQRRTRRESLGAWQALVALVSRGSRAAESLADEFWPGSPIDNIVRISPFPQLGDWLLRNCVGRLEAAPFALDYSTLYRIGADRKRVPATMIAHTLSNPGELEGLEFAGQHNANFLICQQRNAEWQAIDPATVTDVSARALLESVKSFAIRPSTHGLADALIDALPLLERARWRTFPWPIQTAITICEERTDLEHQAALARKGELGSPEDWEAAETRWRTKLQVEDFVAFIEHDGRLGRYLRDEGVPLTALEFLPGQDYSQLFNALVDVLPAMKEGELKRQTAELAMSCATRGITDPIAADKMIGIMGAGESTWFQIGILLRNMPQAEERLRVYDFIGSRPYEFSEEGLISVTQNVYW